MRSYITFLCFTLLTLSMSAQKEDSALLYVGTFTAEEAEGIYLCGFEEQTGKIALQKVFKGIDNPSFLQVSPNSNFLYTVTRPSVEVEQSGGYVQAYKIGAEGELSFINKQISNGSDPCHIDISTDGKSAAIATYGGGSVSLYRINRDGSLNPAVSIIKLEGSGPNQERQKAPHAHSVLFTENSNKLFSADLGSDRVNIFELKEDKLVPASQPYLEVSPGAGPRHIRFHPGGNTLYVINELNSTISVFTKTGEEWEKVQSISSLPEGFEGTSYCADIHVSDDGKYLYGSNRGHNSIAVFKIADDSNRLEWVTAVSSQGDWPRNFTLSPRGKFLLAANQRSGDISVFRINPENGIPEFTGNKIKIPAPVCLNFR